MALPPELVAEIRACRTSHRHFSRHLKIQHKLTRQLVPLDCNKAQLKLEQSLDVTGAKWLYDLKARQIGSTTYLLSRKFRKALLTPNYAAGVVAHTDDAVQAIFRMAHRFYDNLPQYLRVKKLASSANEILFEHGGRLRVTTAGSESFRGQTYDGLLLTEFASYRDPKAMMAAILNTATPNADVWAETTAKGMNHAYDLWHEPHGWSRVFLSWRDDPTCRLARLPNGIDMTFALHEYKERWQLDQEEANWVAFTLQTKCAGDWGLFNQENSVAPEVAFITTGARVFSDLFYPDAESFEGYLELEPPQPGHVYTLGADAASGSPTGDHSAHVVLDVTDSACPKLAATYYARVPPMQFSEEVHKAACRYKALAVVESNHTGCVVLEYLVRAGYPLVYRTFNPLKVGQEASSTLGFATTANTRPVLIGRLHTYLRRLGNLGKEPRIQHEVNTFVYDDHGKPGHDTGKHDDILFALALAIAGKDQTAHLVQDAKWSRRPKGYVEVNAWEQAHNCFLRDDMEFGNDSDFDDLAPGALMDVLHQP